VAIPHTSGNVCDLYGRHQSLKIQVTIARGLAIRSTEGYSYDVTIALHRGYRHGFLARKAGQNRYRNHWKL
jgi:hypothetical protein